MVLAGVFSPVRGQGGARSALTAALRSATPHLTAKSESSRRMEVAAPAAAAVGQGLVSSVPPLGGFAARLPTARSTNLHFPATAAAAGAGFFSPVAPKEGVAVLLPTACVSYLRIDASASPGWGLRSRTRTVICAATTSQEDTPQQEGVTNNPPPLRRRSLVSTIAERWEMFQQDVKKSVFKLLLLFTAIVLANLSYMTHPYSGRAIYVIAMCDRAEKLIKFAAHFGPILAAFWKFFSGPDTK